MSQRSVGKRLRSLRRALGFTQEFMADATGLTSPSGWTNYETGVTMIPPTKAGIVCILTGANWNFIYGGELRGLPSDLLEKILSVESPTTDEDD